MGDAAGEGTIVEHVVTAAFGVFFLHELIRAAHCLRLLIAELAGLGPGTGLLLHFCALASHLTRVEGFALRHEYLGGGVCGGMCSVG